MKYWKEHKTLARGPHRPVFGAGLALLLYGWRMTGKLSGLGLMLLGILLLLTALCLYNKPFEEPRTQNLSLRRESHDE